MMALTMFLKKISGKTNQRAKKKANRDRGSTQDDEQTAIALQCRWLILLVEATINAHWNEHAKRHAVSTLTTERRSLWKQNVRPLDNHHQQQWQQTATAKKKWRCKNYSQHSEQAIVVVLVLSSSDVVSFINYWNSHSLFLFPFRPCSHFYCKLENINHWAKMSMWVCVC